MEFIKIFLLNSTYTLYSLSKQETFTYISLLLFLIVGSISSLQTNSVATLFLLLLLFPLLPFWFAWIIIGFLNFEIVETYFPVVTYKHLFIIYKTVCESFA